MRRGVASAPFRMGVVEERLPPGAVKTSSRRGEAMIGLPVPADTKESVIAVEEGLTAVMSKLPFLGDVEAEAQ